METIINKVYLNERMEVIGGFKSKMAISRERK